MDAYDRAAVARESGLVTRDLLLEAGVTGAAIRHRVRSGRLYAHHRGVYSPAPRLTMDQSALAAVLACGPGSFGNLLTASGLWRMLPGPAPPFDVLRLGAGRSGPAGVRLHRTARLPLSEVTVHRGVPVTTAARTLLDLAATGTIGRLELALDEARVRRLVTRAELERLAASGRRGSRALRALLQDAPGYTREEAERRFRSLILRAQLPRAHHNAMVLGCEVDAYWPDRGLVAEVDGYAAHTSQRAFERDRQRDQVFAANGLRVVRFTWWQITRTPEALVARLAGALAA